MIEASKFVSSDLDVPRGARLSNTRSHSPTARPSKVATRSLDWRYVSLYCIQFGVFLWCLQCKESFINVMKVLAELFTGRQPREYELRENNPVATDNYLISIFSAGSSPGPCKFCFAHAFWMIATNLGISSKEKRLTGLHQNQNFGQVAFEFYLAPRHFRTCLNLLFTLLIIVGFFLMCLPNCSNTKCFNDSVLNMGRKITPL